MSTPHDHDFTSAERQRRRSIAILATLGALLLLSFLVAFAVVQGWLPPKSGGAAPTASAKPTASCTAPALPQPKTITLNVYNATDRTGLAGTTAKTLKDQGFAVASVTNDPLNKKIEAVAEIRHGPSGKDAAAAVALRFPGAVLVADNRPDASVDVAIGQAFAAVGTATAAPAPPTC